MNTLEGLLAGIVADPLEETRWLVLADRQETTDADSFPANPWGLFDMHGNVWEWCQDWYGPYSAGEQVDLIQLTEQSDECSVLRGGCWFRDPGGCRSASRFRDGPDYRNSSCGFRCVFRVG